LEIRTPWDVFFLSSYVNSRIDWFSFTDYKQPRQRQGLVIPKNRVIIKLQLVFQKFIPLISWVFFCFKSATPRMKSSDHLTS